MPLLLCLYLDRIVGTNTKGVFFCLKHEIRHLRTSGGGATVNNTSAAGLVPTEVTFGVAQASMRIRRLLQIYGLLDQIGEERLYDTNQEAAHAFWG